MAVVSKPDSRSLKVVVSITKEGKATTSTHSYANVKADAEDGAIYNVGAALADLQTHPLTKIAVVTTTELEETA